MPNYTTMDDIDLIIIQLTWRFNSLDFFELKNSLIDNRLWDLW